MELLNPNNSTTQELNFDGFVEVVRCGKYLANQGIAYRRTTVKKDDKTFDSEPHGKFTTLLKHIATYHSNLRALLARDLYISPKVLMR